MALKTTLTFLAACATLTASKAGEVCAPVTCDKNPTCEADPQGSISFGYHSDYIFRGFQFSDETWIADANYSFPTCVGDLTLGVEYITSLRDGLGPQEGFNRDQRDFERANLYVSFARDVCGFEVEVNYVHRHNPGDEQAPLAAPNRGDLDTNEFGLAVTRCFLGGCMTYEMVYDLGAQIDFIPQGFYHSLGWNRVFEVNRCVSLVLDTGIGYYDMQSSGDYLPPLSGLRGFSHRQTTISAPIQLGCQFTLTPYVGYIDTFQGGPTHRDHSVFSTTPGFVRGSFDNGPFPDSYSDSPDDKFFGGISASYSF